MVYNKTVVYRERAIYLMETKTYCAAAFTQIYADNASRYRLCCHAGVNKDLAKYTTNNTTPFDYYLSDEMEDVRDNMLSGKRITGCETCYEIEDRGHESWRQWKYNKNYELTAAVKKVHLKLRIMGSFCNLGCYMCHPYNSSTRRIELKQKNILFDKTDGGDTGGVINVSSTNYNATVSDILDNIHLVGSIHLTGGEPLQLPRMWEFMKSIPNNHASNIHVSMDSNLTELNFKDNNIWQLVDKFNNVGISVSCDHYGDKLSWIRYPIDVEKFEKNIKTAASIINNINVTVSILNILELFEIRDYYHAHKVSFTNIVTGPKMLSIRNLPQELKDELKIKYADFPTVIQELDHTIIHGELDNGIEYCRKLNSNRNINFDLLFDSFFNRLQAHK